MPNKVYLLYHAEAYEGLGYPSVHATYEGAFADFMDGHLKHFIDRMYRETKNTPVHALSIQHHDDGTVEFVELFNMNYDHPEREPEWSDSTSNCISVSIVKG